VSVGALTTRRVAKSPLLSGTTSTWNPHRPQFCSYNGWQYALFGVLMDDGAGLNDPANRTSTIYKRKIGTDTWSSTGRVVRSFGNFPCITIDRAGRFYLAFNCFGNCTSGGATDQGISDRFYCLVFSKLRANGSFDLSADNYENLNETTDDNFGYMALSTDPASVNGNTYAAMAFADAPPDTTHRSQWIVNVGDAERRWIEIPRSSHGDYAGYAQMAMSKKNTRYVWCADLEQGAITHVPPTTFMYSGFRLYKLSNQVAAPVLDIAITGTATNSSDPLSVANPRFAYPHDMCFTPDGRLYAVYAKENGDGKSYLIKETGVGTGKFSAPIDVGTIDFYTQIQVSSAGHIYLVESSSRAERALPDGSKTAKLIVHESTNDGASWTTTNKSIPIGSTGFPSGSNATYEPVLVKPWTDPHGHNHDLLHGVVPNQIPSPGGPWPDSDTLVEFEIPVV
jgi:hypothetical protein